MKNNAEFWSTGQYFSKNEIPITLRSYVHYTFSSGGVTGSDFKSFSLKYANALKKLIPDNWIIYSRNKMHYEDSFVLQDENGKFYYLSYPDVRYWDCGWVDDLLIRTMSNDHDWRGGRNNRSSLYSLRDDLLALQIRNY